MNRSEWFLVEKGGMCFGRKGKKVFGHRRMVGIELEGCCCFGLIRCRYRKGHHRGYSCSSSRPLLPSQWRAERKYMKSVGGDEELLSRFSRSIYNNY
jgi:hypothetical protein